ncbi:MAG: EAL domain-containing protein [Sedimenticola sp.]
MISGGANHKLGWTALLLLGVVSVLITGWLVYGQLISESETRFQNRSGLIKQTVNQRLASADGALTALVGMYQASEDLEYSLLTVLSEKLLDRYPFVTSIGYLSWLEEDEGPLFEREMHSLGLPQYRIKAPQVDAGEGPKNGLYEHHLAVSFFEPMEPQTAHFLGQDWIVRQDVMNAFEKAVDSDGIGIAKFMDRGGTGYALIRPTFFGLVTPETSEERNNQVSGAFVIMFNPHELLHVDDQALSELSIRLLRFSEGDSPSELFRVGVDKGEGAGWFQSFNHEGELKLNGQKLRLEISMQPDISMLQMGSVLVSMAFTAFIISSLAIAWRSRRLAAIERYNAQEEIFKEKEKAEVTLQSIGDAVITTDTSHQITYINPVAEQLLGYSFVSAVGQSIQDIVHLKDQETDHEIPDAISYYLVGGDSERTRPNSLNLRREDREIGVDGTASALTNRAGESVGAVLVLRDVSLERELTSALAYQASHDALTGLLNRNEFEHELREALEESRTQKSQHALCYLDLDQFKLVNDTCGHLAGDSLLKQIAGLLHAEMRDMDVVARLGGDEFGVLVRHCGMDRALEVAERIRHVVGDYRFKWDENLFDVRASIGVVTIDESSGVLTDVLSAADLACYTAKDKGRDAVHLYKRDDQEMADRHDQMQWMPRIQGALRNDEFDLYIQRIVALGEDAEPEEICEFLVRWPQAGGGQVSPGIFIPAAERYDLMRNIDRWVVEQAFLIISVFTQQDPGSRARMYTINLSGQSIGDPKMAQFILEKIQQYAVAPQQVCFEITETAAIANFSVAEDFIRHLRNSGCHFALDDFGSGLSSFGYLKRLPVDLLKIDGQFVRDMCRDPVDHAMVRTIHDVARVLKLKTIAEWVEDEDVLDALKEIGVDYAQGYHIGKPRSASELLNS